MNYTDKGEQVMILDPGVPVSLAWRPWLHQYLKDFDLTIEDMESSSCYQVLQFRPSETYESKILLRLQ